MLITRRGLARLIRSEIRGAIQEQMSTSGVAGNIWAAARDQKISGQGLPASADLSVFDSEDDQAQYQLRDDDEDGEKTWYTRSRAEVGAEAGEEEAGEEEIAWGPWVEASPAEQTRLNSEYPGAVKASDIRTVILRLNQEDTEKLARGETVTSSVLDELSGILSPHGLSRQVADLNASKEKDAITQKKYLIDGPSADGGGDDGVTKDLIELLDGL